MYERTVLGIDFNNLLYAAYYKPALINRSGMNVNAIRGFFLKLRSLKQDLNPDMIVISRDVGRDTTLRRQLYPLYKAQRGQTPTELKNQIEPTLNILDSLGFPILENPIYESDDILGMLSRYCNINNYNFIIASSDKDFFQLINDRTNVFNMTRQRMYTYEDIIDQYELEPHQLIDLKAIMGDQSDNIPGVYGIGDVIGRALIKQFKSLDGVYSNLQRIKPTVREKLESDKKNAYLSYILGKIITDYSLLDINMKTMERREPNMTEVYNTINMLGLSESLNMMMRYDFS